MILKVHQALDLHLFLNNLEKETDGTYNKNKITDRAVRMAVIDNIIALTNVKDEIAKKVEVLQEKYFTDKYNALLQAQADAKRKGDTTKEKELYNELIEEEATFKDDYTSSLNKIINEEIEVNITPINRDAFDEATDNCKFSIQNYVKFAFLFSN